MVLPKELDNAVDEEAALLRVRGELAVVQRSLVPAPNGDAYSQVWIFLFQGGHFLVRA